MPVPPVGTPGTFRFVVNEQSIDVPAVVFCTTDSWRPEMYDSYGVPEPASTTVFHVTYVNLVGDGYSFYQNVYEGTGDRQFQPLYDS